MERATVIVAIEKGRIGKVRIRIGDSNVDRFAKDKTARGSFKVGDTVRIVGVTDEHVFVEEGI
jgi:hypothetical protein